MKPKGYIGSHRRKIANNSSMRNKYGKVINFTPTNSQIDSVVEDENFTPQNFISSSENRYKFEEKTVHDFMDEIDFDNMGKSQITLVEQKKYDGEMHCSYNFSEIEVNLLKKYGFSSEDFVNSSCSSNVEFFTHLSQTPNSNTGTDDWITVPFNKLKEYPTNIIDSCDTSLLRLQPIFADVHENDTDRSSHVDLNKDFHVEGEQEIVDMIQRTFERRTVSPWDPEPILKSRFATKEITIPESASSLRKNNRNQNTAL